MRTTVYESKFYPETKKKWASIPGGKFVGEVLVNYLISNFSLAYDRKKTGLFGISTGARGGLLLACKYKDKFSSVAGFSGDYDPVSMKNSKILINIYGEYKKFKQRWANDDNVMKLADNLKDTSIYLSHGTKDYIVPRLQTVLLVVNLKKLNTKHGGYDMLYKEKKHSTHDWKYWRQVLPDVMSFFDNMMGR